MRPLAPLPLGLLAGFVVLGSSFALPAAADPEPAGWTSSAALDGFEPLEPAERRRLAARVANKIISYSFEDESIEWRIHRGDVVFDGNLDNSEALIVDGSLRLTGSYDDYGQGAGLLIVLGDLEAANVFTWNGLFVSGAVRVQGLLYGAYNDYAFEAGGGVSARGIVMDDHSSSFTVTAAEFEVDNNETADPARLGAMARLLAPEILAEPGSLELDEYSDLAALWPDYDVAKGRLYQGLPLFREPPAPAAMLADLALALAQASSDEQLLPLIGRDPLVDRVIAARPRLSASLVNALLAGKDPGVKAWLAGHVSDLDQLGGVAALTVGVAERLVANPETSEKTLAAIAGAADPALRRTLSQRADLPLAVLVRLAGDADPDVRAAVFSNYDNAERLPPAEQQKLAADPVQGVREAVAGAPPGATVADKLAADPSSEVRLALAVALAGLVDHPFPAIAAADRQRIAEKLVAGGDAEVAGAAFVALSPARQEALYRQGELLLDWGAIAQATRSHELQRALFEKEKDFELQGNLAENLSLPLELQLGMVARAAADGGRKCEDCVFYDSPMAVLAALLGNDNAAPEALVQACHLALRKPDADFVSALTNRKEIPLEGLQLLNQKWAGTEDWSLSVISMQNAARPMLERALPRWHEEEAVTAAVEKLRPLDDDAFWRALAESERTELRDAAAWNANTPPELLLKLIEDPDEGIAAGAAYNPSLPAEGLALLARKDPALPLVSPRLGLAEMAEMARSGATYDLRQRAREAWAARHARAF